MNKIFSYVWLLTIMVIVIGSSVAAQNFPTDKGSKIVSGGFTFSSAGGDLYESADGDRQVLLQFSPSVSYFVIPGVALGGEFLLEYSFYGDYSDNTWGIGPHILYFLGGDRPKPTVRGTTYPYMGAGFFYSHSMFKYGEIVEVTSSGHMISLEGGILHMLSNAVGLFGEADYQMESMNPEGGDSVNGDKFNIAAGFTVFLY